LEQLFSSEPCHLALLLKSFFDESFHVSSSFSEEGKVVDFLVTDFHGVSYRDRIHFYVTCLAREEAEESNIPAFIELITFKDYPVPIKFIIDEYRRNPRIINLRPPFWQAYKQPLRVEGYFRFVVLLQRALFS